MLIMLKNMSDKLGGLLPPVFDLYALNIRTCERIVENRVGLVTGLMEDSIRCMESFRDNKSVRGYLGAHSMWACALRDRSVDYTKQNWSALTEAQGQFNGLFRKGAVVE
jgi:hypothetical protein